MLQRIAAAITGHRTQERLAAVERAIRKLGEAERDRASSVDAQLTDIARVVGEQPTAKDLREFRQALRGVAGQEPERRLFEALDHIASNGRPLLIGPWTGEVGFELLYWIPFVEWVRAHYQFSSDRELIVSRGGVASWYRRDAAGYADILAFSGP